MCDTITAPTTYRRPAPPSCCRLDTSTCTHITLKHSLGPSLFCAPLLSGPRRLWRAFGLGPRHHHGLVVREAQPNFWRGWLASACAVAEEEQLQLRCSVAYPSRASQIDSGAPTDTMQTQTQTEPRYLTHRRRRRHRLPSSTSRGPTKHVGALRPPLAAAAASR